MIPMHLAQLLLRVVGIRLLVREGCVVHHGCPNEPTTGGACTPYGFTKTGRPIKTP